jgi:hypothetical protein
VPAFWSAFSNQSRISSRARHRRRSCTERARAFPNIV